MVSAGDVAIAAGAKAVLTVVGGAVAARGGPKAAAIGAVIGTYAGKGVDVVTTIYNLQHDFRRVYLGKPLEYSVGFANDGTPVVVIWNP